MLCMASCKTKTVMVEKEVVRVVKKDTTIWRDTTYYIPLFQEHIVTYRPKYDTLHISSAYADFSAWVDTCAETINGAVKSNKKGILADVKIPTRTVVKDSVVYVDKPYPVEVEKKVVSDTAVRIMAVEAVLIILMGILLYFKTKF